MISVLEPLSRHNLRLILAMRVTVSLKRQYYYYISPSEFALLLTFYAIRVILQTLNP